MKRNNPRPKRTNYIQINNTINANVQNISINPSTSNNKIYIDRESSPIPARANKENGIMHDIHKNSTRKPNGRRWSAFSIGFFILLFFFSPIAYRLLKSQMTIPAESTIHLHAQKFLLNNSEYILKIENLTHLLNAYRKNLNISDSHRVDGIISVDAVSLFPYHKFLNNNTLSGFLFNENFSTDFSKDLQSSYSLFENYLFNNSNKTIKAGFVYQFQPLDLKYPVFLIHLFPWHCGKANNEIEKRLFQLKNSMEVFNFHINGFAFDGDNTYRHNLRDIVDKYDFQKNFDNQIIREPLFFSDYLHLLKRARYRLLKLIRNNTQGNQVFKNLALKYNLPYIVLSDEKITKMHDSLVLKLFNLRVLLNSENFNDYGFYSYLLPWSLMLVGLNYPNVSLQDRIDLYSIGLKYLSYYPNKQFYNGEMFLPDLLTDSKGTLISLLIFSFTHNESVSVNRLSSNPLEHSFGTLRMKANYDDSIDKFISNINKLNFIRLKRQNYEDEVIHNRVSDFGRTINLNQKKLENRSYKDSVIYSIFQFTLFGFKNEIFKNFTNRLNSILNQNLNQRCKICIKSSNDVMLNPGTVNRINTRQQDEKQKCQKRCKWTAVEDELLINTYEVSDGNLTKIIKIFNSRSPNSVKSRIQYLKRNNKIK